MKITMLLLLTLSLFACTPPASQDQVLSSIGQAGITGAAAGAVATQAPEAPAVTDPDFRKAAWGMSQRDAGVHGSVLGGGAPGLHIIHSSEDCTVGGMDCAVGYIFVGDELAQGKIIVTQRRANATSRVHDFDRLVGLLTEKYGRPASQNTIWLDDLYKDDPSNWGMAVATGRMSKFATWENARTAIAIGLFGDNFDTSLVIEYNSVAHKAIVERLAAEAQRGGL